MFRTVRCFLLIAAALGAGSVPAAAQDLRPRAGAVMPGDTAPDFTVQDLEGKATVRLSDLKGKPVVLVFGSCT